MFNKLEDIIKKLKGNVLIVGLDDKLIKSFDKNNSVNLLSISKNNDRGLFKKRSKRSTNKGKVVNIKKLRKYVNKKSVDTLICNMNEMMQYYKYFIKDSVYINNNKIYIYADKNIDKSFLIDRYKRYNNNIKCTDYKNGFIIEIDNKNSKNNFIKDRIYFIKDTFYNVADFIGNILVG